MRRSRLDGRLKLGRCPPWAPSVSASRPDTRVLENESLEEPHPSPLQPQSAVRRIARWCGVLPSSPSGGTSESSSEGGESPRDAGNNQRPHPPGSSLHSAPVLLLRYPPASLLRRSAVPLQRGTGGPKN